MEIAPKVHSISIAAHTFMGIYAPNIYLVLGKEAVLVDSGYYDEELTRTILEYAGGLDSPKLAYILVTHPHPDHIGGCLRIKEVTGAKVLMHSLAAVQAEKYRLTADILVEDGDIVDIGGAKLEIIHTPGHTSGHICAYFQDEGILFTGDHILGIGTTVIDPSDGDMAQYIDSLKKLLNYRSRLIFPGHGPPIREPERKIKELIAHRREREQQLLFYLSQRKRTLAELVAEIYPELDQRLVNMAEMQIMGHLKKLVLEEKVAVHGDEYTTS
ncbi:MAG: MBL fold metallo-hydrolase [Dehalococcoidia bacterium]